MAPTMELEAKNIKEAVKKACDKLNISRSDLKYDIISYGSSGIFGLGRTKKAKIRVMMPDEHRKTENREIQHTDSTPNSDAEAKSHLQSLIRETFNDSPVPSFPDNPQSLGKDVLRRIIDSITTDASISVEEENGRILFNVQGGNSAILIGKHGQTLEAIQSLVEKIVNKHHSERIRVQVDVEGYLENRKINLIRHAERQAKKCKRIRKPVTVGYMNAHDRRIVHVALKNDREVRTHSMGDGFLRKLMIFPKKKQRQNADYGNAPDLSADA